MWLKKVGSIFLKFVGVVSGFAPLVSGYLTPKVNGKVERVIDKLTQIGGVVVTVEQAFAHAFGPDAKKGSDKLRAATPFVAQILQQSELLIGRHPKDPAAFEAACTKITEGFADLLNSVGD